MSPQDFKQLFAGLRGESSPVKLVAVRGALENGAPNKTVVYDDVIFVVNEIAGTVTAWLASVDPSLPLIQNPINPDGAAQLMAGVWFFRRGIHKSNPAWPCFIQAEDFTVYRLRRDGTPHGTEKGDFGIHLHSGGEGTGTGRFSAGCQIIHNADGYFANPTWGNFYNEVSGAMKAAGVGSFPYLLIDAASFRLPIPSAPTDPAFKNPVTP